MAKKDLGSLLLFITLWDAAEAAYCYYYTYNGYTSYYCTASSYLYLPIGSIAGAVIGSLVFLAVLIGLIVFFCCIRPRRMAARGQILHTPGSNVAVVGTTAGGVQMGGGYINTAAYPPGTQPAYPPGTQPAYPPGTQPAYPQYNYPPEAAAPDGKQPPPPYT
ncbi:uncharacterized protein [Magallana gigas]|uniref:uncharacterized protein n=1 Tax=Magallana gigas TaxID=29159 RepID=UPI0005C3812F|eukprot:XP_011424121.1 PREDICTED: uncharacterized protein LOC105325990 [Crassostrea gigas]